MKHNHKVKYGIISVFVLLYMLVSTISMIHSIDFFGLSNNKAMSITLSTAFEVGQVAALCGILILDKTNRFVIWSLFLLLTAMQIMSNVYFCYKNLGDYSQWSQLFGLNEEEPMFQKRMLSIVSGAVLPLVALGFIKSLVDYVRPASYNTVEQEQKKDKTPEVITLDESPAMDLPGTKFDASLNIDNELQKPEEVIKQVITKPSTMPRTPAQYTYTDPITGGGSLAPKKNNN